MQQCPGVPDTCLCAHEVRDRGHAALDGHSIAEQSDTNRTQHNDVLKSIFRFSWESGSFRGGRVPTGAQGHGLGHLWQRLGPCAVLSGSVLAKSIFPVRGSLQAELGEQDRVPWCCPWKRTLPTGGAGGSQGCGRPTAVCSQEGPRTTRLASVLQLSPCPTGDSVSAAQGCLTGWAASLPW